MTTASYAPELLVQTWFNTDKPLLLAGLQGRVVVLAAFQVLCPNSVAGGVPQAQSIFETFEPNDVAVIGLHATFEHHDAFNVAVLKAFIHEYRLKFPIALDQPNPDEPDPAHHGPLQDARHAEPGADRPAGRGAQARVRSGRGFAHRRGDRRAHAGAGQRRFGAKFGGLKRRDQPVRMKRMRTRARCSTGDESRNTGW